MVSSTTSCVHHVTIGRYCYGKKFSGILHSYLHYIIKVHGLGIRKLTVRQTETQHTFCDCPSAHFLVILYSSFSSTAMSSPSLHTMQDQSQNKLLHYSTLACAHKHTHTYTHFSWTLFFTVQARTWSQMNNHHSGFSAHRSGYITIH